MPIWTLTLAASFVLAAEDAFRALFNGQGLAGWANANCAPEPWSDGAQQVTLHGFARLMRELKPFVAAAGREL